MAKKFTLGSSSFYTENVARFFEDLRTLGMEGKYQLPRDVGVRQYVICGVFSQDEIESNDGLSVEVEKFKKRLLEIDQRSSVDGVQAFYKKFICCGRLAVLLNNLGKHGEARLFDPDGVILKDFGITQGGKNVYERHIDKMKERFVQQFGPHKPYYIVLMSHLIPCTEEEHECARLVREYAERSGDCIIISYDNFWHRTNTRQAVEFLTHDNIKLIKPKERRPVVNKDIAGLLLETEGSSCRLKRGISNDNDYTSPYADIDEEVWFRQKRNKTRHARTKEVTRPGHPIRDMKKKKRGGFGGQSAERKGFNTDNE